MRLLNILIIVVLAVLALVSINKPITETGSTGNYIVVDFSIPNNKKRLFIYDKSGKLLFSTYVAHGSGSGRTAVPTSFGNTTGSKKSSLGTYKLGESYFGHHGKSIKLDGLSPTNSKARFRYIVIHSAPYIIETNKGAYVGYSEGCFAVSYSAMKVILKLTKQGDLLIAKN